MGLDVVELIMEIEDAFKITISDEEASTLYTVENLYQCVLAKADIPMDHRCSTQKVFYLLRTVLQENIDIARKAIAPKTNTSFLFPLSERRKLWSKISANVPYKFPKLMYPALIGFFVVIIALISSGYCSYL